MNDIARPGSLLVIGMPRAMTTTFTRALGQSLGKSAAHETLFRKASRHRIVKEALLEGQPTTKSLDDVDNEHQNIKADYYIKKEMATICSTDIGVEENSDEAKALKSRYEADLKCMIKEATDGVILMTASPISIFHSLMRKEFENIREDSDFHSLKALQIVIKRAALKAKNVVIENHKALETIKRDLRRTNKKHTIIDKDKIKTDPEEALKKVTTDLGLGGTVTTNMLPTTRAPQEHDGAHYFVTYDDQWTSQSDYKRTTLDASPKVPRRHELKEASIEVITKWLQEDGIKALREKRHSIEYEDMLFTPDIAETARIRLEERTAKQAKMADIPSRSPRRSLSESDRYKYAIDKDYRKKIDSDIRKIFDEIEHEIMKI